MKKDIDLLLEKTLDKFPKLRDKILEKSDKFKQYQRLYQKSDKFKQYKKQYQKSEKYKQYKKQYQKQYYLKNREKILAKLKNQRGNNEKRTNNS